MSYSHKQIRRFCLDGEIYDDASIPRLKEKYIFMVVEGMKHKGYVPRYDIDPDFTVSYNGKTFDFKLSVYGVYVGKKSAKCLQGIDKNFPVKNSYTQKIKSEELS